MEAMTLAELGEPRIFEGDGLHLAGLVGEFTPQTMDEIPKQWQRLDVALDGLPARPTRTYGVVYRTTPMRYFCGVDAAALESLPETWQPLEVPPQRYAAFAHGGGVDAIRRVWMGLGANWMPLHKDEISDGPAIEFYAERFGMGTDRAQDRFEIWLPLKM